MRMGSVLAQELAGSVGEGDLALERALEIHLRSNHYPPVPASMVAPCIEAIQIVQESQWGERSSRDEVELPEGILYRGRTSAPASAIVKSHHLDHFIQWEEL